MLLNTLFYPSTEYTVLHTPTIKPLLFKLQIPLKIPFTQTNLLVSSCTSLSRRPTCLYQAAQPFHADHPACIKLHILFTQTNLLIPLAKPSHTITHMLRPSIILCNICRSLFCAHATSGLPSRSLTPMRSASA